MKRLYLIIILLLIFCSCQKQDNLNNYDYKKAQTSFDCSTLGNITNYYLIFYEGLDNNYTQMTDEQKQGYIYAFLEQHYMKEIITNMTFNGTQLGFKMDRRIELTFNESCTKNNKSQTAIIRKPSDIPLTDWCIDENKTRCFIKYKE